MCTLNYAKVKKRKLRTFAHSKREIFMECSFQQVYRFGGISSEQNVISGQYKISQDIILFPNEDTFADSICHHTYVFEYCA